MILIVDDSEQILDWLRDVVQGAGYYYDSAVDARSAFYKMQRVYYALALIDIVLPDSTGSELATWIKGLPEPFSQTPLVAMTGSAFTDDLGLFATVLQKPFLPRDLRSIIRRYARPPVRDLHLAHETGEPPSTEAC